MTRNHTKESARALLSATTLGAVALISLPASAAPPGARADAVVESVPVYTRSTEIDGTTIYYREAGVNQQDPDEPVIVLLHGFPTSSHMFRDFIPLLADEYRVIAPDYPGYGLSDAPSADEFEYTFDNIAGIVEELLDRVGAQSWVLYLQDYGAPVGFRLATKHPERVAGLIVQNGNAYEEGLPDSFWGPWRDYWKNPEDQEAIAYLGGLLTLESTIWQFTHGTRIPEAISPDNWLVVQPLLDRPGNVFVQLELAYDYGSNPPRYPQWQAYLREHQPPTIITWGRHDKIFPASGALPYLRDLPNAELHLLDTGHFALDEDHDLIAALVRRWLEREVVGRDSTAVTQTAR
ncbi:MAG: alpha/beta fold hydrolase [Phycisphaerales bacterium JB043]